MSRIWFVSEEFDYATFRFRNVAQYIQLMHPEYRFALRLGSKAINKRGCTREQAIAIQADMLANVCAQAKSRDLERGLTIVIQDESYPHERSQRELLQAERLTRDNGPRQRVRLQTQFAGRFG